MNKTAEFFKAENDIHLDALTLEQLILYGGYNLSVRDAAELLDISERYLCDILKEHFDYIVPPKRAKICLTDENLTSLFAGDSYLVDTFGTAERFNGYISKKIFINSNSFKQFLLDTILIEKVVELATGEVITTTTPISQQLLDDIFDGKGTVKSLKTLKQQLNRKYNTQVYRHVKYHDYPKLLLTAISEDKRLARYYIPDPKDC